MSQQPDRDSPPEKMQILLGRQLVDLLANESRESGKSISSIVRTRLARSYESEGHRIDWLNLITPYRKD